MKENSIIKKLRKHEYSVYHKSNNNWIYDYNSNNLDDAIIEAISYSLNNKTSKIINSKNEVVSKYKDGFCVK